MTEPSANGKFAMLRGRPIRTVRPVSASMLATVSESGSQAPAAGAGVAAEQEHVVAAVVGVGDLAVAEHRDHEVALHADQVGTEQQARRPPRGSAAR